jgi:hypothetical protein
MYRFRTHILTPPPPPRGHQDRAHVWLQLTTEEVAEIRKGQAPGSPELSPRVTIPAADGKPELFEFHVDDSDAFTNFRGTRRYGGELKHGSTARLGAQRPAPGDWACDHGHEHSVCRCHLPVALNGQDESVTPHTPAHPLPQHAAGLRCCPGSGPDQGRTAAIVYYPQKQTKCCKKFGGRYSRQTRSRRLSGG